MIINIKYLGGNAYITSDNEHLVCPVSDFHEMQLAVHNYLNHPESEFEICYSGRFFDPKWIGFTVNGIKFRITDIHGAYNHETEICMPIGVLAISAANDIVRSIVEDNYSEPMIILPKTFKFKH